MAHVDGGLMEAIRPFRPSFGLSPDDDLPNYTEADLDPHAIGDAQQIADYFRSLGYCVKTSDTDLFGDLDRVIPIASEITFASFDLLTHHCHIVEAGNNSFFRAMTGRIRLPRPSETTPTAGYVGKENTGELPRPLLKYARQASLVDQPTLPGLGLQYCCSSCA